jgi:hypothetical protein
MEHLAKKYCLLAILCAIVCKALLLYPPYELVTSPKAKAQTIAAIQSAENSYEDLAKSSFVESKFSSLNSLTIWECEETEEDEKSDDNLQRKNCITTVLKGEDCDALNSHFCSSTVALFILFHSWKSNLG